MPAHRPNRHVTACIPYYRCKRYIRRAVQSLLSQTHREITVVVVNDGDPDAPWDVLADIRDQRLVRYSLPENRGPYFATAIALNACSSPYFLIQDADDWSQPLRVERLLNVLERDGSDFSVSAAPQFIESSGRHRIVDIRWRNSSCERDAGNFVVHHRLTPSFKYRAPHHGLFRTSTLRAIGGYYGGLRISYDTLMPNLILMVGRLSHVPEPLYYRLLRTDSLTHSPQTGVGSTKSQHEQVLQRRIYQACFSSFAEFSIGHLTAQQLAANIRRNCGSGVTPEDRQSLRKYASLLRAAMPRHHRAERRS